MSEGGEKTLAPTEKKLRDSAQKGDVLRSREIGTAGAVLIGAAFLKVAGPWMLDGMEQALRAGFVWDRAILEDFTPGKLMLDLLLLAAPPVMLLGLGVILISGGLQLGFGDGRWVGGNALPKASRLNPLSGLKRMFGATGWIEIAKGLAKVALLGAIAWAWAQDRVA
ncbi:MAG: hypothetical protein RIQ46_1689, partial [Pseudomonadota bacterium]